MREHRGARSVLVADGGVMGDDGADPLVAVACELHALPPGRFIAERAGRAKEAAAGGDKGLAARIRKLVKPSAAAWAVNALDSERPELVERAIDLGERLRAAAGKRDGAAVRELGHERQKLLAELAAAAREVAESFEVGVSPAAAVEVQQTFQAAMTDADAADAVRTGLLVRPLSSDGLGPVDLEGALAVEGVVTPRRPPAAPAPEAETDRPAGDVAPGGAGDEAGGGGRRRGASADGDSTTHGRASSRGTAAGRVSASGDRTGRAAQGGRAGGGGRGNDDEASAAKTATQRAAERAEARERARAEAAAERQREFDEASAEADEAEARLASVDLDIRDNEELRERLTDEIRDLKEQLAAAQDDFADTGRAATRLRTERAAAERAASAARREADRLKRRV
jgi:hypothetical protein